MKSPYFNSSNIVNPRVILKTLKQLKINDSFSIYELLEKWKEEWDRRPLKDNYWPPASHHLEKALDELVEKKEFIKHYISGKRSTGYVTDSWYIINKPNMLRPPDWITEEELNIENYIALDVEKDMERRMLFS